MIPQIIHFSVPAIISKQQERVIKRAQELHPGWDVMVWRDPINTAGFRLADYHKKANSGAQLADLIRLDIIYQYGGIYLDSDVFLQKNLLPLTECDNFFCSEDGKNLTNAVYAAAKEHPLIDRLIGDLLENEPDWNLPPNQTTGPVFFARVLHWQKGMNLLPRDTFYPYNWDEAPTPPLPTTYGVHEWAGSWVVDKPTNNPTTKNILSRRLKYAYKNRIKPFIKSAFQKIKKAQVDNQITVGNAYSFGHDLITKTNRGIYMSLPGSDLSITPEIALNGTYEERELKFLERHLRGGDLFVDVGCNVGVFTLVAARCVGPFGRVYALDANPDVLKHLKRSLVMNWVHDRTITMNHAVGQQPGKVELQYSEERLGDANIGLGSESTYHRSTELLGGLKKLTVQQVCLDDLFPIPQEIKILKIDVEGFEYGVLAGAVRLASERCFNFILLELIEEVSADQHHFNVSAILRLMEHGYAACWLDQNGNIRKAASLNTALGHSRNIVLARNLAD